MIKIINSGGKSSIIRINERPDPEHDIDIPESSFNALRLWKARPGEIITLADNEDRYYRARLYEWNDLSASAHVFNVFPVNHESRVEITVFQALPDKERFEIILQKLTEIGVYSIIPYTSKRSVTLEERDSSQKKSHKWPDVVTRAAKQCRRGLIPELGQTACWEDVMASVPDFSEAVILSEHNNGMSIGKVLAGIDSGRICLIVGPEGGFSKKEISSAIDSGVRPVSLGSRILRTETAAIVAASLAVYITGGFS